MPPSSTTSLDGCLTPEQVHKVCWLTRLREKYFENASPLQFYRDGCAVGRRSKRVWLLNALSSYRYVIVPAFLSSADIQILLARSKELLDAFDPDDHPLVSKQTPGWAG